MPRALSDGTKACSNPKCWAGGTPQPKENFRKNSKAYDKLHSWCNKCVLGEGRTTRGKERHRACRLKKYGLNTELVEAQLLRQEGMCGVCQETISGGHNVDHDHITGRNRGLIHWACNVSNFPDDPKRLLQRLVYLTRGPAQGVNPEFEFALVHAQGGTQEHGSLKVLAGNEH